MTTCYSPNPAFHRLGRTASHRWWRPLAVLGLSIGFYLAFCIALIIPIALLLPSAALEIDVERMDLPIPLALTLVGLALMIPAAMLAVQVAGRRPAGTLISIAGGFRWHAARRATMLSAGLLLLSMLVQGGWWEADQPIPDAWLMTVLVLALVPLQATAEEVIFRGLLPQVLGAWFRSPLIAFGVPSVLFMFGHVYSLPGLLATGVFALAASWLTWRSGGIELAVGLHVANNLIAFLAGVWGLADLNATEVPWFDAGVNVVVVLIVTGILWVTCRPLCRDTRPVHPVDVPPAPVPITSSTPV